MFRAHRRSSLTSVVMLAALFALPACATKKYVRDQVATVQPSIAEANNAIKENAERIDAVDRRAQQGITAAEQASKQANQANQAAEQAAQAAQAADRKADTANTAIATSNNRITTLETRINALSDNYSVGETQSVTFAISSATLTDQAKSTLDGVAGRVAGAGYMIELQGFTDSTGDEQYNINLSQRRAENVLRYLVSKNVPLFRISIVGLGEANPVADNSTRAGREQNRRVEVRVLRAAGRATN